MARSERVHAGSIAKPKGQRLSTARAFWPRQRINPSTWMRHEQKRRCPGADRDLASMQLGRRWPYSSRLHIKALVIHEETSPGLPCETREPIQTPVRACA